LNHDSEFLAREFIFAFIDCYFAQMGLALKDRYAFDEIEKAFRRLLIWTDEATKRISRENATPLQNMLKSRGYVDPDFIMSLTGAERRRELEELVTMRAEGGDLRMSIPIDSRKLPFHMILQFLSYLKAKNIKEVDRPFAQKDYSRLGKSGGWVWNVFSPDVVEKNLKTLFRNLPLVYKDIVSQNFPSLANELPMLGDTTKLIVVFDAKETYNSPNDFPSIELYYLRGGSKEDLAIAVYRKGGEPNVSPEQLGKTITLDGKNYTLPSMSRAILNFIFEDTPTLNFVYKILEENLKNYFKDLRDTTN